MQINTTIAFDVAPPRLLIHPCMQAGIGRVRNLVEEEFVAGQN